MLTVLEPLSVHREGLRTAVRRAQLAEGEVDTSDFWQQRWTAIRVHRSQTSPFEGLPEDLARAFLCREHLALVEAPGRQRQVKTVT